MYYKIVSVPHDRPDQPTIFAGEFEPVAGEPHILTALATAFGYAGSSPAVERLREWSGGEASEWLKDLTSSEGDQRRFVIAGDGSELHIEIGDQPFGK